MICLGHERAGLGAEVLNNHFLNVPITLVQAPDMLKIAQPFLSRFTNAHQQSCCHRYAKSPCPREGQPSAEGVLVGRAKMRATALAQPLRAAFQHQPHGGRHRAELTQLATTERARVDVRQQTRLVKNTLCHGGNVIDGAAIPPGFEPLASHSVPQLGLLTKGQQHLTATRCRAFSDRGKNVVEFQIHRIELGGCFGKGAVVTDIAA